MSSLTTQQKAENTVRYLRIAEPCLADLKQNKRLVIDAPKPWPPGVVAQYAMRVALENGCTSIRVRQGVHTVRDYDVMKLVTMTRHLTPGGFLPRPTMKFVPKHLATMGFKRLGATLDGFKGESQIAVPATIPVSGPPGRAGG